MIKLARSRIQALANALKGLDGRADAVKDKDGNVVIVTKPFQLGQAVRYAVARTLTHLRPTLEAIELARNAVIKQHGNTSGSVEPGSEAFVACTDEIHNLMAGEDEVEPHKIKIADLNVEANQLPSTLLSDLDPVITWE